MAISSGPTATLCRWACATRYEDLPADVRKETLRLFYDEVGCMIASATLPSCQPLVDLMRKLDCAGQCSIVGHPVRTSLTHAALANGTIGQGAEVDATGQQGTGHYPTITVPTVLSVGQHVGTSGKELARALALGSEVAARCQNTLEHYDSRDQFFLNSIGGTMGATVSAGLLLGLNPEQMEHALGLAASGACGLSSCHDENQHQTKALHRGRAVEAGVLSALLAREGYHGPKEVMTIKNGFFDAFSGVPSAGYEVVEALGENYQMRQIAYKRYPVGGHIQAPLHAFLLLMKTHKLTADDIEQIEVVVSLISIPLLTKPDKHPSLHLETIFSLAAVYGEITFSHIHDSRYRDDPRVKAFHGKARIFYIPRPYRVTMDYGERFKAGVTVRTRDGATLCQELDNPLMSEAEIQQKFRNLVGLRLASDQVTNLERRLMAVEAEENVAPLVRQLELPYPNLKGS